MFKLGFPWVVHARLLRATWSHQNYRLKYCWLATSFIKALFEKVTEDLSLDGTPTLQPTVMAMSRTHKEDVEEEIKSEEQEVVVGQATAEEETEPLTHLVAEMPESDIPSYIGGF